jgi:hypothetical protein
MMLGPLQAYATNESTTVVMHAHQPQGFQRQSFLDGCDAWMSEFNCIDTRPAVSVEPLEYYIIYVLLRNYEAVSVVSFRFSVDGGVAPDPWGDWVNGGSSFACQGNQHGLFSPTPNDGHLLTTFDCITGGALAPLGFMVFIAGAGGCLTIGDSEVSPTGVQRCSTPPFVYFNVPPENRARICVGPGGYDACDPVPVPVRVSTWGGIKAQYAE